MSDADAWEDWLLAGADDLVLTDDTDGIGASDEGLDDPWGALEIELEPLTDDQRAHLARAIAQPTGSRRSTTGVVDAFESVRVIHEIHEIDDSDTDETT